MGPDSAAIQEAPGVWTSVVLGAVFGFILFAAGAVALIGVWYFHAGVNLFVEPRRYPDPQLETRNAQDLDRLRVEQQRRANQYAWVDKASGVVRIPIPRAMRILADQANGFDPPDAPASTGSPTP